MRRQAVLFLILFCLLVVLAVAYRAVFHRGFHRLTNKARQAQFAAMLDEDAKRWRSALQLEGESEALTNAVASLVSTNAAQVETSQRLSLQHTLTSWLYAVSTGRYEDYLAFRQPDYIQFEGDSLAFLLGVLKDKVPDLEKLADRSKCALLYDHFNNRRLQSVPDKSLALKISRADSYSDFLNSRRERKHYLRQHYVGGYASYESASPFRYNVNEKAVLEKHGFLDIAHFHARLITRTYVVPIHITFFWSPDERRWKPFEFWLSTFSPSPVKGETPPQLFF